MIIEKSIFSVGPFIKNRLLSHRLLILYSKYSENKFRLLPDFNTTSKTGGK